MHASNQDRVEQGTEADGLCPGGWINEVATKRRMEVQESEGHG